VILPVLVAYAAFALLTWLARPLFNLTLRLDRFGRHVLSREEVVASNLVGATVAVALAGLAVGLPTGSGLAFATALGAGLVAIPIAGTFQCPPGWPRAVMGATAAALVAPGGLALALALAVLGRGGAAAPATVFFLGTILSQWLANILAGVRVKG